MNNSRKNAINLLIKGFKFNISNNNDEIKISNICTFCEEYIYKLSENEDLKKYRSEINNFVFLLKNNINHEIKIEYIKGSINSDEFVNKIYNNKNNYRKRQLSKDNINKNLLSQKPNIIKQRKVNSLNKKINIEKERIIFKKENENKNKQSNDYLFNLSNQEITDDKNKKEIDKNNFRDKEINKIKNPFNLNKIDYNDDNINYKNIIISTDINNTFSNITNINIPNYKKENGISFNEKEKDIVISKNNDKEFSSFEKLQNKLLLPLNNNKIKNNVERRNKSAQKVNNNINLIELEIENKKLSLENEQLKNNYNILRKEFTEQKEKNLKLIFSNEKIMFDNKLLNEKINKLVKKIEKLKKMNEIYANNINEMKKKMELKNQSIDIKLEKLTQNFNIISTKFLDSSISKINIDNLKKNNNLNKANNNNYAQNIEIINSKPQNVNKMGSKEENNKKESIFDTNISYRSFLDNLNKSKENKE